MEFLSSLVQSFFGLMTFAVIVIGLGSAIVLLCGFVICHMLILIDTGKYLAKKSAGRWGYVGLLVTVSSLLMGFLWGVKLLTVALVSAWFAAPMVHWIALNRSKRGAGWSMEEIRYAWLLGMVTTAHLVSFPIVVIMVLRISHYIL